MWSAPVLPPVTTVTMFIFGVWRNYTPIKLSGKVSEISRFMTQFTGASGVTVIIDSIPAELFGSFICPYMRSRKIEDTIEFRCVKLACV